MKECRGGTKVLIQDSPHVQSSTDYSNQKPAGGERVKVSWVVGFIAESPCGMWIQMLGVSQSLLVSNGII